MVIRVQFHFVSVLLIHIFIGYVYSAGESNVKMIIPPPVKDLGKDYKLRIVYFVPSDKQIKRNYKEKTEVLMRVVADVYNRELKANGFDTEGLDFEFDDKGSPLVHLVKGKRKSIFYRGDPLDLDHLLNSQQQEIWEQTGFSRNRPTLVFSEAGPVAEARPMPQVYSGLACVSASALSDEVTSLSIVEHIGRLCQSANFTKKQSQVSQTTNGVIIHEIGHIFGMLHDTSDSRNIMMRGYDNLGKMFNSKYANQRPVRFSKAHARIASFSRFLSKSFDMSDDEPPNIKRFEIVSPVNEGDQTIKVSIEISDNSGLGSVVVMQRGGGQIDALTGDFEPKKTEKINRRFELKSPKNFVKGQPVVLIMNCMDINGNLAQSVLRTNVNPKKNQSVE